MVGLERHQREKPCGHHQDTLRNYPTNAPHNGYIRKRICDICLVGYLECHQMIIDYETAALASATTAFETPG